MKRIKLTSKILKYLLLSFLIFIVLASTGIGIFVYFFPKEKMCVLITEQIESTLNRKITIKNLNYGIRGVSLRDVVLYDGKTSQDTVLTKASVVHLSFSFFSLLQKKLEINKIYLKNLYINIIFDKDGKSNIEKLYSEISSNNNSSTVSAKISKILLRESKFNFVNLPKELKELEGLYLFDGNIFLDNNDKTSIYNCSLILPDKRGALYPQLLFNQQKSGFSITGNIKLKNYSLQWLYKWANKSLPFNVISGDIENLKITKEGFELFAKLTSNLTTTNKMLFADGFAKVNFPQKTVFLSDINGKLQTSTLTINNLFFNFKGDIISFNFSKINAFVIDLRSMLESIPAKLFGKIEGLLSYNGKVYNGSLNMVEAGYGFSNKTLSNINTKIIIKDNLFKNENIPVRIHGYPAFISIASTDPQLKNIILHINAKKIVLKPGSKTKDSAFSASFPVSILCTANINELMYDDYTFNSINLNTILAGPIINVRKLSMEFANGHIDAQGVININEKLPKAFTSINFRDIKIQALTDLAGKFKNRIFGFMSGKAKLNLELSDQILDKIDGTLEFTITNGKLSNTGIQDGLGIWLSELKYKLRNLEFNTIYGNIYIAGMNFNVNSFIFNSQNIKLNIKGKFNKQLIADPLFINLEFTKYFIQDLAKPAVILGLRKYKQGDWYIIPFKHEGDISESKNMKRLR